MRGSGFSRIVLVGLLIAISLASLGCSRGTGANGERSPASIPAEGPIVVALTGDTELRAPVREPDRTAGQPFDLLRTATLAFTNLETALLDRERALEADARPLPRWSFGAATLSGPLRDLGFDLVSLANNHAMDFGPSGLASTTRRARRGGPPLRGRRAGSRRGASADLYRRGQSACRARRGDRVRAAGERCEPIAAGYSRPTRRESPRLCREHHGRCRDVSDAQTVSRPAECGPSARRQRADDVRHADRARREDARRLRDERADERAILDAIREARRQTEFVIVSLHSHEPSNASDEPAEFIRRFAHDAVDAGARIIVGHGPHRVRGAEIYKSAPIFYSLGNFIYDTDGLDFRAADSFDAGQDLFTSALGALGAAPPPLSQLDAGVVVGGLLVPDGVGTGRSVNAPPVPGRFGWRPSAGRPGPCPDGRSAERGASILRRFSGIGEGRNPQIQQDDAGPFAGVVDTLIEVSSLVQDCAIICPPEYGPLIP